MRIDLRYLVNLKHSIDLFVSCDSASDAYLPHLFSLPHPPLPSSLPRLLISFVSVAFALTFCPLSFYPLPPLLLPFVPPPSTPWVCFRNSFSTVAEAVHLGWFPVTIYIVFLGLDVVHSPLTAHRSHLPEWLALSGMQDPAAVFWYS